MSASAQKALNKAIRDGGFAPVYYFHGDDDFLKDDAVKRLVKSAVDPATRDFNLELRRAADLDAETLGSLLGTPPMMAERRVVVLRDVAALTEVLVEGKRTGLDLGDPYLLERYQRWRGLDTFAVALATDARVRTLNRQYRRKDQTTDVLAFPSEEHRVPSPESRVLGDIIIATGVARRQARDAGHSEQTELRVLALHGLLHLLVDPGAVPLVHQGPELGRRVRARPRPQGAGPLGERVQEGGGHVLVHVDALDGGADLAGVGEAADGGLLGGPRRVDALVDDQGVVAAVLQHGLRARLRARAGDRASGRGAADVRDDVDVRRGEVRADLAVTVEDLEHTVGQVGGEQLG